MTREFREFLAGIKMPCRTKYFQATRQTLFYQGETGLWLDRSDNIPLAKGHTPTIQELVNFTH